MQKLIIIDGLSFFFRAYHAVRGGLTRESDGLPTNALYGFSQMLLKVVKDMKPDECCVALDSISPTFRHDMYPEYKANRTEIDEEMRQQLPYFEPLIEAFGIAAIRVEGMEADDIIATLATQHGGDKQVVIVSSDKDLLQLLGGNVTMLDTMKNKIFDPDAVVEKFGVGPEKVIEVQALIGDSSDNIPGVPSVGPKTAAQLIDEYGSLDGIYENLATVKRDKLREKLADNKDKAYLSKELVTLKRDVQLPENIDLNFHPDLTGAKEFLVSLDFKSLAARLPNGKSAEEPPVVDSEDAYMPRPRYTAEAQSTAISTVDHSLYETVTTPSRLEHWLNRCRTVGTFALDTETTNIDAMQAELVGISLAVAPNEACYIPLAHQSSEGDLLAEPIPQLPKEDVLPKLKELLLDETLTKVAHNLKYDLIILRNAGLDITNFEDTMLMSAALDAGKHAHNLDFLSVQHFAHKMMSFSDVAGRGQKQVTFDYVPLKESTAYAAEDADITLRLYQTLKPRF
ncbi:MAG: hypothetical protein OXR68_01235 [Alphaproteobacteria bacterium]|nr:hypothetical protein [Alphaproteobacteria bacterium]MDD9919234.1 hypothetical protein [Alphaproteobacteria bacterium]